MSMTDFHARPLLTTDTVAVWDVVCEGTCRHKSTEECVAATHLVFPYRGAYVQHTGRAEAVAEPNQIVFINEDEAYRVSHPVEGGDASLSIRLDTPTLLELASADYLQVKGRPAFNRSRLRLDARVQVLTALVRHRLSRGVIETLEAESLALELLRRALSGSAREPRPAALDVGNWLTARNSCSRPIWDAVGRWRRSPPTSASRRSISPKCSNRLKGSRSTATSYNYGWPEHLTCLATMLA
jgi:hypothetical protein